MPTAVKKIMEEHNIYKSIVTGAILCLLLFCTVRQLQNFSREQKTYGFTLQAGSELTEDIVAELKKLPGIRCFEPVQTVTATICLNQYSMETELTGINIDSSLLRWKNVEKTITLSNTPALFFGKNVFSHFSDKNGYAPEKSQIEAWLQNYQELEVTLILPDGIKRSLEGVTLILPEDHCTKKARICGILEEPADQICMDKQQSTALFGHSVHILGGYMRINGYQNMKEARKSLEETGFVITEAASSPAF